MSRTESARSERRRAARSHRGPSDNEVPTKSPRPERGRPAQKATTQPLHTPHELGNNEFRSRDSGLPPLDVTTQATPCPTWHPLHHRGTRRCRRSPSLAKLPPESPHAHELGLKGFLPHGSWPEPPDPTRSRCRPRSGQHQLRRDRGLAAADAVRALRSCRWSLHMPHEQGTQGIPLMQLPASAA